MDVAEAHRLLARGVTLVDVRNPEEVARTQVPVAVKLPLPELSAGSLAGLPAERDTPILTICAAGTRSLYAQLLLKAQGYSNVRSVDGGMSAWVGAGLPTQ